MGRKLRVFISSTINDLQNERLAVVKRIDSFNIEPVNAESWAPGGEKSWSKIEEEIKSSDIFVLISGSRYGWIPDIGPMGNFGLSVTHLEYRKAKELGLPILAFFSRLGYDDDHSSEDAVKRDAFRKEVKDWAAGFFVQEFHLYEELQEKITSALINILTNAFQREKISKNSLFASSHAQNLIVRDKKKSNEVKIPSELVNSINNQEAILFAGSGISLAAGLPSATVLAESFLQLIQKKESDYFINPTAATFSSIATDLINLSDRTTIESLIKTIIDVPQGLTPTTAHFKAVELFDQIITTNYDNLFEKAASILNFKLSIITDQDYLEENTKILIKLHGSIDQPNSLLLTEFEIQSLDKKKIWKNVVEMLNSKQIIVLGTSLRDPSIIRLFNAANRGLIKGYYIAPHISRSTFERVNFWNLNCIESDADLFMEVLSKENFKS